MAFTDLQRKIVATAKEHDDRYFLRRRFRKPARWEEPTDIDHEYDACEKLVFSGHARRLAGSTAPGIELTGKPLD